MIVQMEDSFRDASYQIGVALPVRNTSNGSDVDSRILICIQLL
jgi:hypothetical protein